MDGPDDSGQMFERPGRLTDVFVGPYKNDAEARNANSGALPPDLTYIVLGRNGGEDYIFHLLLHYTDPPAGVVIGEGQAYNLFFDAIAGLGMPKVLFDGVSSVYLFFSSSSLLFTMFAVFNGLAFVSNFYVYLSISRARVLINSLL